MKCIYKIGNEELNNDMLNELLNDVKVENVFSASAQFSAASDEMMDALSKIKSDAGYHTITKKDGGVEVTIDEANGISFNDFIDKAVNKNGEKWIKDFNEEEYKTALKAKVKANEAGLVFKGKTYTKNELSINDSVVDEYVETKVKQNQKTGEIGMSVHRAMTKIMNHKNEENNSLMFIKLDGDKFTDSKGNTLADDSATITFIDKLMEDANFKKMDLNAFVKFYNSAIEYKYKDIKNRSIATNYLTSSKDPISGKNIYALVDLVTIDNDGRVDLIFYNASNSDYTDWTEEKRERLVYKMMMARHLLISQGVSPKKIHVQVKPISINYDDDMNIINVFADKGDVNLNTLPASGKNTRFDNQTQGSYASNINEVIPLAPSCFSDSIKIEGIEDISKQMSHLFSSYKFRGRESESEYQDFISSKIKSSDNLEKGAWMYWNMFEKGYVYIADDGKSKEDSPNVRSAVVAYVTRRRDDSNNVLENIGEAINEILSGRKDLETALSSIFRTHNDKGKMYLSYILSKYSSDNNNNSTKWTALEIPELNAMGIIPIQNTITKQIDFISLTDYDPNASMKMKTDNRTIVGDFANLKNINSEYLLSGKLGNIELIKLMLVINKYYSVFATGGFQIGEIQVINPNLGTGMIASRKQLVSSFNTLLNLAKANTGVDIENNFKSGNIKFTNDINVFQSMFLNLCSKHDAVRSSVSVFGTQVKEINNMSEQSALALLYQIEDALTRSYPEYFTRDKMRVSVTKNNDVINLFKQITEAINMYEGGYMAQNENLTKFDIYFRNPDNIPSAIARMITEKVKGAFGQISAKMTAFSATIHNTIFDELYIYKGYGFANKMIGNQAVLFENLFEKEPGDENKIHHMMKVRNPFKDNSLSDSEKVFLKKFLFEVNTIRTRNDNSKKDKIKTWDDPAMESMINNDDMFLCIPLLQASSASKYTQGYYKDRIANSVKNMLSPGKVIGEMNERLHENMENYITPDERTNMNSSLNEYKMYNRFKVGETQEGREGILSSKEQSYWETNLENVLLEYKYAALREDELKRPLLYAKALTYQTLL